MRTWELLIWWTGERYIKANCGDNTFEARGPKHALKIAGLDDEAVLCGVQPLNCGQPLPICRFPGGAKVVDPKEIKKIIEW